MHSDRQAEVANAAGTITFIGGGNMARSLIGGLLARGREPAAIHVAEPHAPFRAALARDFSVHVHADNIEAAERGAVWVFADYDRLSERGERQSSRLGQWLAETGHAFALSAWSEDRIAGVPESWQAFGERVMQSGERLAARGNQKVLVLTSGGVISRLAQAALGASDRSAVDLNLSLRMGAAPKSIGD